ncbi:MAG TPA: right-handed parallel beta-helix repeat-containing protein [Phycisphaerales bacterium]|nr:right-handed parallel beta-helix repeat-containing protein [Phycisphaerales bacterium]
MDHPSPADSAATLDRRFLLGGLAGAAGVAALAAMAKAGPLAPPAGAVAPTGKTLSDIEPRTAISTANTPGDADSLYRITSPGSYYLTDHLLAGPGKSGIEITASNVTVDLNGFQIGGFGGLSGVIATNTALESITIRNGRIRTLSTGVSMVGIPGLTLEALRIESCLQRGAQLGIGARVDRCAFVDNGDDGLFCGEGSSVGGSTFSGNGGEGLYVNVGASSAAGKVCDCVAIGNDGTGIRAGGSIVGCVARENGHIGIVASGGAIVADCSATANGRAGFYIEQSQAVACAAASNVEAGFIVGFSARVAGCMAYQNGVGSASLEAGGFTISGRFSRIEDCHSTGNLYGYRMTFNASVNTNILVRNTAGSNSTNWLIRAGNVCLVVSAASVAADFTGNSGGVSPGSTNPSANYTV